MKTYALHFVRGSIALVAVLLAGIAFANETASVNDNVIVVAQAGQTDRKAVGFVLNTLKRVRANVIGLVLNEVTHEMGDSYSYYGKYYKYYRSGSND